MTPLHFALAIVASLIAGVVVTIAAAVRFERFRFVFTRRDDIDLKYGPPIIADRDIRFQKANEHFTINGGVFQLAPERSEFRSAIITLPRFTRRVLLVGWGAAKDGERWYGGINDDKLIARVSFLDSERRPNGEQITIGLPMAGEASLKIADADPILTGMPPDKFVVTTLGLGGITSAGYIGQQSWDQVNLWLLRPIRVPRAARYLKVEIIEYAWLAIVHAVAVRRLFFPTEVYHRVVELLVPKNRQEKKSSHVETLAQLEEQATRCSKLADDHNAQGNFVHASSLLQQAAFHKVSLAYLPPFDRQALVAAGQDFKSAADCLTSSKEPKHELRRAKLLWSSFECLHQAGSEEVKVLFDEVTQCVMDIGDSFYERYLPQWAYVCWRAAARAAFELAEYEGESAQQRHSYLDLPYHVYVHKYGPVILQMAKAKIIDQAALDEVTAKLSRLGELYALLLDYLDLPQEKRVQSANRAEEIHGLVREFDSLKAVSDRLLSGGRPSM